MIDENCKGAAAAAADAAKSLQSCPTLLQPQRRQPTLPCDSPGKNTGVGCHFLLQCMKLKSENWKSSRSVVSDSSRPYGPQPTGLLYPWDFPGKITGVGCHCLLLFPLYISPKYGTSLPASTTEARISLPYLTAKVEQKKLPRVLIKIMKTHAILILFLLHHYHWLIFTSLKYVWKYRKNRPGRGN